EDVIGTVRARWVYGLTATPKRDDGMEKKVYMQFGPVRYRYTAKERAAKQGINHFVYPRFTRMVSSTDLKINEAYKAVVSSEIRNRQIINDVEKCISEGRTPLVLSKYKEHAEILYKMLEDKSDHIFLLQGGGSRKEKDRIREEMRSVPEDETVILVAIDKYIGEGFNYPRLDTMMLTMPVAWEGNVEQYAGRLHRDYESKKNVIIYDYVDVNIRVLEKMYHKRLRTYKKIGYEICSSIITEKQETNSVYDMSSYLNVYQRDLAEANSEIIISSPGLNKTSLTNFLNLVQRKQEDGVMITVVTLDAESYPAERVEAAAKLIEILRLNGINVVLKKYMHEHFAIIDKEIVWYGSVNLLSSVKEEDNIMRIKSTEISQELMEITFSEN
ncbi:MAG: phospholipase D-like domain-containing protein, partial [Clostridia bacterium]|nr:phospholipase D-like domain-containing protein [Clostridia bacterium]